MPGIHKCIAKVCESGFIVIAPRREHARTVRASENIAAVAEIVREDLATSTRYRSQELNI